MRRNVSNSERYIKTIYILVYYKRPIIFLLLLIQLCRWAPSLSKAGKRTTPSESQCNNSKQKCARYCSNILYIIKYYIISNCIACTKCCRTLLKSLQSAMPSDRNWRYMMRWRIISTKQLWWSRPVRNPWIPLRECCILPYKVWPCISTHKMDRITTN